MNEPVYEAQLRATINHEPVTATVPVRLNLVDFLRDHLDLTGTHIGCEHGACGACTVIVDGALTRGCLMLAVQIDGTHVETIEGAHSSGRLDALTKSFYESNALQCGFCTPGMLLSAAHLLAQTPTPERATIRDALSGNLCRCTGYQAIVDAIERAATRIRHPYKST